MLGKPCLLKVVHGIRGSVQSSGVADSSSVLEVRNIIKDQNSWLGILLAHVAFLDSECRIRCGVAPQFTNEGKIASSERLSYWPKDVQLGIDSFYMLDYCLL